jgi:hypothetical protein
VYVHVGPPKTGTTYLQDVLWRNQRTLAGCGVVVPGRQIDHFHAALDLRGIAFGGHDNPEVPGAWDRLVSRALGATGGRVVLSHEVFAGARPEEIARAVSDLSPAAVHVVYAVRDLGRQLPAVWQEGLKNRKTIRYEAFLRRTLQPEVSIERGFWRAQHAVAVLARWREHLPVERIHVVTLPPAGAAASGDVLWRRFCDALGIDGAGVDLDVARSNASLSPTQCELLRRLNAALPDDVTWPAYENTVKRRFNELANEGSSGARLKIPLLWRDQVDQRAEEVIQGLAEAGYPGRRRPRGPAAGPDGVRAGRCRSR